MEYMLDLETMSSQFDAAIVAIGAVRFDWQTKSLWHPEDANNSFYCVVNLKSAQKYGGRIDADTVMWWLRQNDQARSALLSDEALPIEAALKQFANWVRAVPCTGMWGNGADFDNVVIGSAYQRIGWSAPWPYYQNRCYRTLKSLPNTQHVVMERKGAHHNAVDDARSQALHLCEILKQTNFERKLDA